jgi:hypothetical protein
LEPEVSAVSLPSSKSLTIECYKTDTKLETGTRSVTIKPHGNLGMSQYSFQKGQKTLYTGRDLGLCAAEERR